jgi:glycosyltransferase involved in cell wall biosynthesis
MHTRGANPVDGERVLVIIPAYNEEEVLASTLAELRLAQPHLTQLVVDDGSVDATATVARHSGAEVVILPFNLGIGGALRTGFMYAIRNGYTSAIQFDADGQHDPTEIPVLLQSIGSGSDLVIGSRFAEGGGHYEVGRVRRAAMSSLRWMIRRISRQEFSDTSSGFRAFSERALRMFSKDYPVEYMESVESLLMAVNAGLVVCEVPVRMRERAGGVPSNRHFRLVFNYVRLLVVLVLAAVRRPRHSDHQGG